MINRFVSNFARYRMCVSRKGVGNEYIDIGTYVLFKSSASVPHLASSA